MKVYIRLERDEVSSPIIQKEYTEELVDVFRVECTHTHILFHMRDNTVNGYRADKVLGFSSQYD